MRLDRITVEPGKMDGQPCIRGMRLTVRRVVEIVAGYIVRTDDHGFHQMTALAGASGPSVIRIRLQGLDHEEVAALVDRIVKAYGVALDAGALVSVLGKRVRVRKLPIIGRGDGE